MDQKTGKKGLQIGKIRINPKQFGFIDQTDIYVHENDMNDALDKDLVEYEVNNFSSYDKQQKKYTDKKRAKIKRVVKRHKDCFVVEVLDIEPEIICRFDDIRIPQQIRIKQTANIDIGDKLFIKITSFKKTYLKGELMKRIGHKLDKDVDVFSTLYDLNITYEFSNEVKSEIKELKDTCETIKKNGKFTDLSDKSFFTIDPNDSKDFDDAICVEKKSDCYVIYVAISDVWSYLKKCPQTTKEAYERGTSIYLINSVIPMIPELLSNNLCSIVENQERNVIVMKVITDLDGNYKPEDATIFPAIINSKKRFKYDEVNEYFEKINKLSYLDQNVLESLNNAFEIYKKLDNQRQNNGYLQINKNSWKFNANENNEVTEVFCYEQKDAQKLIETFMVMANENVAFFLKNKKIKTIFRHHDLPKMEKITNFLHDSKELGLKIPAIDYSKFSTKTINNWINLNDENPNIDLAKTMILQCMEKAIYTTKKSEHFGLNLKNYLHFTSPIRRFSDLIVHKQLWMHIFESNNYTQKEKEELDKKLEDISKNCTDTEIRASEAEYLINKQKIFKFIRAQNKNLYIGYVCGRVKAGFIIKIQNIFEIFIKTVDILKLNQKILLTFDHKENKFIYLKAA